MHVARTVRAAAAALLVLAPTAAAVTHTPPVAGSWRSLPPAPVRIDGALTSAWTGKELVVFGRRSDLEHPRIVRGAPQYWTNVAAAYDPVSNRWRRLSPPAAADAVGDETAVWTESR